MEENAFSFGCYWFSWLVPPFPFKRDPADAATEWLPLRPTKARYPGDHTARKAFKRWCKSPNGSWYKSCP